MYSIADYFFDLTVNLFRKKDENFNYSANVLLVHEAVDKILDQMTEEKRDLYMKLSLPLYYHGTDLRIFNMPTAERKEMHKACNEIGQYLFEFYKRFLPENSGVIEHLDLYINKENPLRYSVSSAVSQWRLKTIGAAKWQYEETGIYLTSSELNANDYAYRARYFGEIGSRVYLMMQGIKYFPIQDYNPSQDMQEKMDRLTAFAEDTPQPIVFAVKDVDYKDLYAINGVELTLKNIHIMQDVRCVKDIELDIHSSFLLKVLEYKLF